MHGDVSDQPGVTKRGYRIVRFLGAGSVAAVYEARRLGQTGPGTPVACKLLQATERDHAVHREMLRYEAVIGLRATFGHPNVVEVLDFFEDAQERQCIVMELVDGACLDDLYTKTERVPAPIVRRIADSMLEALAHLHGRGVLHRDLSRGNVLVTTGGVVKLTDLGLARTMEHGRVHTDTGNGTLLYASSEALENHELDARADLYSLAAILFHLVAGQPPCGWGLTSAQVLARSVMGMFVPLPPDTPADLAELIKGLLHKDRDARRPGSAAEALALLRSHEQPMASAAELATRVTAMLPWRDRLIAQTRPVYTLEPGQILAPRDLVAWFAPDAVPAARPAARPAAMEGAGRRITQSAPEPEPAAEVLRRYLEEADDDDYDDEDADAADDADGADDAAFGQDDIDEIDEEDHEVGDALDRDIAGDEAGDEAGAVPPHRDNGEDDGDGQGEGVIEPGLVHADEPAELVTETGRNSESRPGGPNRWSRGRVRHVAFIGACVLALAALLDDGLQPAPDAPLPAPSEPSRLVALPIPPHPSAPPASAPEEPRDVAERADSPPHERASAGRGTGQAAPRWRSGPQTSEPPTWGLP